MDYSRLICRSPEEFMLPEGADQHFSVPLSIAFGEEEFKPYTMSTHRYRFYPEPRLELALPEEVKIGKFQEIYVYAYEDQPFFERKYSEVMTFQVLNWLFCLISFAIQEWRPDRHFVQLRRIWHLYGHVHKRDYCNVRDTPYSGTARRLRSRDCPGHSRHERPRLQRGWL